MIRTIINKFVTNSDGKKLIDEKNGYIYFRNAKIKEDHDVRYLQGLNLGSASKLIDIKNGWQQLLVDNILVKDRYLNVIFFLFNNKLKGVDFEINGFNETPLEKIQIQSLNAKKLWFENHIVSTGIYKWGKAFCNYSDYHQPHIRMGINYEEKF